MSDRRANLDTEDGILEEKDGTSDGRCKEGKRTGREMEDV